MDTTTAVNTVNGLAFRPGWRFHAEPPSYPFGARETIYLWARIDTVNTSYPSRDGQCRKRISIRTPAVSLDVSELDEAGLCHRVLQYAAELDKHENREFLKIRQADGSWYAPLHPHTPEGNARWAELQRTYDNSIPNMELAA